MNFVAYRPRWVAATSGEVKLSAKVAYNFFNSIITINLYNNIFTLKTTINIIINIVKLAAKGGLQVLQHQPTQRYLPSHSGWLGMLSSLPEFLFSSGWLPCRPTSSTTLNPQVAPNYFLIYISARLLWWRLLFFLRDSFDVSNLLCVSTSGFQSFKSLSRLGLLSRPTEN